MGGFFVLFLKYKSVFSFKIINTIYVCIMVNIIQVVKIIQGIQKVLKCKWLSLPVSPGPILGGARAQQFSCVFSQMCPMHI